ncbi:MAG: hypothetical protein N2588_12805 [Rhodovarius sp.]|nr:hypothetical protein [Rhodovarius sp.]
MTRRRLLSLPLLLPAALLAACAADLAELPGEYLGGVGDPVRGTALRAPFVLGDTSRYRGDPASAAYAAAQLEFLARSFETDPRYGNAVPALRAARQEMRAALGIPAQENPEAAETRLRIAAQALREGSRARAESALAAWPPGVIDRLAQLPRLPAVATAAGIAAQEIHRLDQEGLSRGWRARL